MTADDELDEAVPMTPAEKSVQFFKGEEDSPLKPKEITEEMLATLYDNMQELEHLSKLVEMSKKDIKELGRGLEGVQKGPYVVFFKTVKGRKSINWQKFVKDSIGELSEDDLKKYTDEGEPTVRLEIKKVQ